MSAGPATAAALTVLVGAAVVAVLAATACGREARSGSVPIDTAATLPLRDTTRLTSDTTPVFAPPDSAMAAVPVPAVLYRSDSAAGDSIYHGRGRCFTCHGARGRGTSRLGPDLADSVWLNGDSSLAGIRAVIAAGVAVPRSFSVGMPAYQETLDDSAITRAAIYVYALTHSGLVRPDSLRPRPDSTARRDTTPRAVPGAALPAATSRTTSIDTTRAHGTP